MFVLINILNHELFIDSQNIEGESLYGVGGWSHRDGLEKNKENIIERSKGKDNIDDWEVIEIEDGKYYKINDYLNNDTDLKAYYSIRAGTFEIMNTRNGRIERYE